MPWEPTYSEDDARAAITRNRCWADVLRDLGLKVHGKNLETLRKWADRWGIDADHLPSYQPRPRRPRFREDELREAIANSRSWAETLRYLQYRSKGGNWKTLKKYAALWGIDSSHFDPYAASLEGLRKNWRRRPIEEILVEGSTISRHDLKIRLYAEGLKQPICELCGQGEIWRGKRIALILDHINGIPDDNRLENLRIVCPNCAATLETHCGRKNRRPPQPCAMCGEPFEAKRGDQKYCSRECGSRAGRAAGVRRRRADRPPYEELLKQIHEFGYLGVGRLYGVSDNAIRKWARAYERDRAEEEGADPSVVEIPTRTWPNRRDKRAAA